MKLIKYTFYTASIAFCVAMFSCTYDIAEELSVPCDESSFTYSAVILPIIEGNCYTCHSASEALEGIVLEPYSELLPYAESGRLSCVINHGDDCPPMPQNAAKLSDCEILLIENWIANGAQDN